MKYQINKPLVFLTSLCIAYAAHGQNKEAVEETPILVYKVKAGDNISKLAHQYLLTPAVNLDAIQQVNHLKDIHLLTIGAEIKLPRHLVKTSPSKATIMGLSCATAISMDHSEKPLTTGSVVHEGAVIDIPPECHASLRLDDGSIIRLPSSASLKITTLRKNALESDPEIKLDLIRGRVELDVHKGRDKSTPFEIRTPRAMMGVRGTEFRVGYSPEDQSSQVEVLGGIVQTRGSADAEGRTVTQGFGVPIDADGKALPTEKLLDPPVFEAVQTIQGPHPSFVVKLSAMPRASFYTATHANTADFNDSLAPQHLLTPELFISKLSQQASFYLLSSVSESGLVGIERNYAFCISTLAAQAARCSAVFDIPLAGASAINFKLTRSVNDTNQQVVHTQNLQVRNGRFSVQGLPAGNYAWTLSYPITDSTNTAAHSQIFKKSGSFELIVLSATAKP